MTLQEAITILTIHNDHNPNYTDAQRRAAHQLGIEALKQIKIERSGYGFKYHGRLPGETEK